MNVLKLKNGSYGMSAMEHSDVEDTVPDQTTAMWIGAETVTVRFEGEGVDDRIRFGQDTAVRSVRPLIASVRPLIASVRPPFG
ncbi:hypothetical protein E2542_SST19208 [Spatholobus suberectus]|nr:hypothetical protein E2542_SST19208 [Spatholobus suberectus]